MFPWQPRSRSSNISGEITEPYWISGSWWRTIALRCRRCPRDLGPARSAHHHPGPFVPIRASATPEASSCLSYIAQR